MYSTSMYSQETPLRLKMFNQELYSYFYPGPDPETVVTPEEDMITAEAVLRGMFQNIILLKPFFPCSR